METDDFSFPTIPDPAPNQASSKSLWRVPSGISMQSLNGDDDAGGEEKKNDAGVDEGGGSRDLCVFKPEEENSFLDCNDTKRRMKDDYGEEKMDMLWENFNDGDLLRRVSSPFDVKKGDEKLFWGSEFESKNSNRRRRRSCSTALSSPRRQSLVMILKVLKKLLLLQDSLKVPGGLAKTH